MRICPASPSRIGQSDFASNDFGGAMPAGVQGAIYDEEGNTVFGTNTRVLGVDVPAATGDDEVSFVFDQVPLLDGTYLVTLALQTRDEGTVYDWREQQYTFSVLDPSGAVGRVALPVRVLFDKPEIETIDI